MAVSPEDVLSFWFEVCTPQQWFAKDAAFDADLKERFGEAVEAALSGALTDWEESCRGRLALVMVLDQFTRNIHRDTPRAFAGDPRALAVCQAGVAAGDLAQLSEEQRQFLLMPMMHSEQLSVHLTGLPLFEQHTSEMVYDYAVKHHDIVARFGRYPHRNGILGRETTEEERMFLTQPGSSF